MVKLAEHISGLHVVVFSARPVLAILALEGLGAVPYRLIRAEERLNVGFQLFVVSLLPRPCCLAGFLFLNGISSPKSIGASFDSFAL